MGKFLGGCFSVVAFIFGLSYLLQHPTAMGAVIGVLILAAILGVIQGFRISRNSGQRPTRTQPIAKNIKDDDEEGDIRHHYNYGGRPLSIDNPGTIQNQSMSFGDEEDEERG